jgi:hypothetical protein
MIPMDVREEQKWGKLLLGEKTFTIVKMINFLNF